jgi:NTP pyrophosphatase (non-canonical NTP hydrolase)
MSLNELRDIAFLTATEHGWWDSDEVNIPEKLALMHSELSEALEEYRAGHPCSLVYESPTGKPEGFGVELADTIIRILDLCGFLDLDIESIVHQKMQYNNSRPYKHGGKKC